MNETKLFTRLNALLRSELGTSPTGLPNFEWGWSEDPRYFHPVPALDDSGTPIYDTRCLCGLNIREDSHRSDCSQIVVREQRYVATRLFNIIVHLDETGQPLRARWLLWRWNPPPAANRWRQYEAAGLHPGHYRRGGYEPCTSYNSLGQPFTLCIPRDMLSSPDKLHDFTMLCIRAYQRRLRDLESDPTKDARDRRNHQQKVAAADREDLYGRLHERLPHGELPGTKGRVSYPSPPSFHAPEPLV